MFEWFQPHRTSYAKSRILDPIQNSTDKSFQDIKIATFPLDSIMYEGMGWYLFKHIKPSMYLDVGGVNC